MNPKRSWATVTAVLSIVAFNFAPVLSTQHSSSAATKTTSTLTSKTTVLYLDIGASVSVGVQPTPRHPRGQPTNRGYSNRLVTFEASKGINIKLTELGCPGESIATMLRGPDPCYAAPDTQLSDAVAFLHAHHKATTLVTVDLGFNTLNVCLHHLDIDLTCVVPRLRLLRQQLTQVMRALTNAAGSHVVFIGLGHYNPYLALSTKEGSKEVFATNSVVALRLMNSSLSQVYGSFNVSMADIAKAFHEEDSSVVRISKKEASRVNVQFECKLTWMCASAPYGPNVHPNDAGYLAIANAIEAMMPPKM